MNHKAKLVLAHEVYRKIKWLTHNYDKEIGAVGVGKMRVKNGEKQFYVDKLFFPKQKVSSATVHFTSEMWMNLIQNKEFMERQGDMCFYWHKHPGSATHSTTDEEDTFETFMAPEAKRKWFGFLQTASKNDGKDMDTEARIELATPLRVSIEKGNIDLLYELSPAKIEYNKKLKEETDATKIEMEALIEEVVEKPTYTPTITTWKDGKQYENGKMLINSDWDYHKQDNYINPTLEGKTKESKFLFGTYEEQGDGLYMDNDTVSGQVTSDEEKASIEIKSGQAKIKTGKIFEKVLIKALNDANSPLKPLVKKFHPNGDSKGMIEYILQPHKKQYKSMKAELENIFVKYNEWVESQLLDEQVRQEAGQDVMDYSCTVNKINPSHWEICGDFAVWQILGEMEEIVEMDWDAAGRFCKVSEFGKGNDMIGTVESNEDGTKANFKGDKLITILAKQTDDLLSEDCLDIDLTKKHYLYGIDDEDDEDSKEEEEE